MLTSKCMKGRQIEGLLFWVEKSQKQAQGNSFSTIYNRYRVVSTFNHQKHWVEFVQCLDGGAPLLHYP